VPTSSRQELSSALSFSKISKKTQNLNHGCSMGAAFRQKGACQCNLNCKNSLKKGAEVNTPKKSS